MTQRALPPHPVPASAVGRRALWRLWACVCLLVGAGLAAQALADEGAEYRIKAAFLSKFGNYVEWPEAAPGVRADAPFGIGVVASDAVVEELVRAARGHQVQGRPIVVRRLAPGDAIAGLCIVFVARSHAAQLADTLAATNGKPILTVTEVSEGLAVGSMVNFVVVDDKVKFDIALPAASASELKISARLLAVARNVSGKAP